MINKEIEKEKIRQRYKGIDSDELDIIPAIPEKNIFSNDTEIRVAVYVRVSTDDLSQTSSFELQKNHYEDMIKRHNGWKFIKIYADEGISGTSLNHRQAFMDMINDRMEQKIDLIITKSVSRFARNLLDCIGVVRKLKELDSPVGVFFETENFCTLDKDSEVKLALISTFAQEESHNKSEIMNASIEMRFRRGIFLTPPLLGYDQDETGNLIINEREAQIVRLIFFMYLYGYTCCQIAEYLTNLGCKTKRNNTVWSPGSILQILQNERHCGAVYARKTWTPNYLDHKSKKNKQNRNQYRRYENHEPIISKDDFIAVQHFINNAKYGNKRILPELKVITQGVLTGFVPIHTHWAGFKAEDYIKASNSVIDDGSAKFYEKKVELMEGEFDFRGYEIARSQFFNTSGKCFMTISNKYIQFSSGCIHKLNKVSYIEMLIFPKKHLFAIRPSDKNNKNAVKWTKIKNELMVSKPVSGTAFLPTIYEYFKTYDIFAEQSDFNGTYGVIAYNKTKQSKKRTKVNPVEDWIIAVGCHKGIISGYNWVRVQNILGENGNKSYRKPRVNSALLRGIIYCSCGSRMGPKMGRNGAFSYVCRLKLKSNRGRCRAENINGVKLDNYVVKLVKDFECDNICLIQELEKGKKHIKGSRESNMSALCRRLSNNKNEINSLVSKLADANSSVEKYIIDRINVLDAENTDIARKISEQEKTEKADKMTVQQIEEFKKGVMSFSACVDNMSFEEKRAAIKTLINRVTWNGSSVEVIFATKDIISIEWNNMPDTNKGYETWEKLKYWRCKRGYLQREVADAVGITRAMYMAYEKKNGFCPAESLVKIAEFLDVDFKELAEDYHYFQLADNQREKLKTARESLRLSKTKFAELVGVDRSTVYKWEKFEGKMSRRDYLKVREITEF